MGAKQAAIMLVAFRIIKSSGNATTSTSGVKYTVLTKTAAPVPHAANVSLRRVDARNTNLQQSECASLSLNTPAYRAHGCESMREEKPVGFSRQCYGVHLFVTNSGP